MKSLKVLFVCLGNICRSPAAEGVFTDLVHQRGLSQQIHIDSAGTAGYHIGALADYRMREHASQRGLTLTSRARKLTPQDLQTFDYILAMDDENLSNIRLLNPSGTAHAKICKMTDYCRQSNFNEVPDPYYGGAEGFELVLDILDDACTGLLETLQKENAH